MDESGTYGALATVAAIAIGVQAASVFGLLTMAASARFQAAAIGKDVGRQTLKTTEEGLSRAAARHAVVASMVMGVPVALALLGWYISNAALMARDVSLLLPFVGVLIASVLIVAFAAFECWRSRRT